MADADQSKSTLTAGAVALLASGVGLIVASVFWIEGALVRTTGLVLGTALIVLGAFFPRIAGLIRISKEGVEIPIAAAFRQVKEITLQELSPEAVETMKPTQLLDLIDRALTEMQDDPPRKDATVSPNSVQVTAQVFEPAAVRAAVSHAAEVTLKTYGSIDPTGTVTTKHIKRNT